MPDHHLITTYDGLTRALATERRRRGLSQLAMDDYLGLADGHTAKIEAGARRLGPLTLALLLDGLGCALVLAPVRAAPARRRSSPPEQAALPLSLPRRSDTPPKRKTT